MYNTGFDFLKDLILSYGIEQGIKFANDYLDMQIHNTDPIEHLFCCDLYQAIKNEIEKVGI